MYRTHDGRAFCMLAVIDNYSRECIAIRTERRQNQETVLETLAHLFLLHGPPDCIRLDIGAKFTATAFRECLIRLDVQTLFIKPGTPWENGYDESSNGKLRGGLSSGEIFYTLNEAKVRIEQWRIPYNTVRPHRPLDCRPTTPQAINPLVMPASATQQYKQVLKLQVEPSLGVVHCKSCFKWKRLQESAEEEVNGIRAI